MGGNVLIRKTEEALRGVYGAPGLVFSAFVASASATVAVVVDKGLLSVFRCCTLLVGMSERVHCRASRWSNRVASGRVQGECVDPFLLGRVSVGSETDESRHRE